MAEIKKTYQTLQKQITSDNYSTKRFKKISKKKQLPSALITWATEAGLVFAMKIWIPALGGVNGSESSHEIAEMAVFTMTGDFADFGKPKSMTGGFRDGAEPLRVTLDLRRHPPSCEPLSFKACSFGQRKTKKPLHRESDNRARHRRRASPYRRAPTGLYNVVDDGRGKGKERLNFLFYFLFFEIIIFCRHPTLVLVHIFNLDR